VPRLALIKRAELIKYLRALGFEGLYSGRRHQFMIKGEVRLRIPNPHQTDIGKELLSRILRQARIGRDTWEKL
jgi:predicted RNA binding protein YcfA (HicA-like mRNA interferase family)